MASEKELQFYNEIINRGCCKRCALRYLGCCKSLLTFDDPDTCLTNFGYIPQIIQLNVEPESKKRKTNPCVVCLGVLQDSISDEMLTHENLPKIEEYEDDTFVTYITFPTCVLVRDHSMKIHLKRNFPECFKESDIFKVNHAWRYTIKERLCKLLKKSYKNPSKLTLHFYTDYPLEEDEMAVVQDFVRKQHTSDSLSKHYILSFLESISDEDFAKLVTIPPRIPLYEVTLKDLKYFSEAIYLMGNYCKYSRELCLIQPENNELTLEMIISNAVRNVMRNYKESIFKASSFDEQTVRVLGTGRTFQLQIVDPKFKSVTKSQCRQIENEIRKSQVLSVQNLREADKRDIAVVIESERISPKSYKLLCIIYKCKNIDYCVNAVNMYSTLMVDQKTPTRFLFARELVTKRKKIFNIRATRIESDTNLIELDICAEAGFHIPEFVNGDFGRTKPSLRDIMRAEVDWLAVDVLDFFATVPCATDEEQAIRIITSPG